LATLDSRGYQRALIQDANRIAERILLPMSLPWTHKVAPVARNIPCDIDEMIDVITMDHGSFTPFENGSFGFGQFDTGQQRIGESAVLLANSSGMLRAAARRSTDPGVIQFTSVALPPPLTGVSNAFENLLPIENSFHGEDAFGIGENLLRCFETMQARKRRKVIQCRGSIKNYNISVKINCSSSRSSIFRLSPFNVPNLNEMLTLGYLEATLPQEVEVGRKLKKSIAAEIASTIGSYNIRQLPEPSDESGKKSSRINVGRTRLMWTKRNFSDQHQRVTYSSLITGQKLDPGCQKRPRAVLVRVIVEGEPFHIDDDISKKDGVSDIGSPFQATLYSDKLLINSLAENPIETKSGKDRIVSPRIQCVPDSCGMMHTVCVRPGKISLSSVSGILNLNASCDHIPCCTVCWTGTEGGLTVMKCIGCGLVAHPSCCLDSGQMQKPSQEMADTEKAEWKCSVCCRKEQELLDRSGCSEPMGTKKSKRKPKLPSRFDDSEILVEPIHTPRPNEVCSSLEIQCAICRHSGGAMSMTQSGDRGEWLHEVCRIWATGTNLKSQEREKERHISQLCALCGSTDAELPAFEKQVASGKITSTPRYAVKCAADGCHIHVHPMCALVSTLYAKSKDQSAVRLASECSIDDVDDVGVNRDISLCDQYTLTFASLQGISHAFGKDPGYVRRAVIPVLFCGIHNPKRERSCYGLYPGGKHLGTNALVVPGCREPVSRKLSKSMPSDSGILME
jgi:hypothetical protein